MEGSAKVDVSPRLSVSPATIFRRIRRMIFPDRVMGRLGVTHSMSGLAKGPISDRTWFRNSAMSSGLSVCSSLSITKPVMASPLMGCGLPTTAACATAGCKTKALSTSAVPIRCPDTFKTSSTLFAEGENSREPIDFIEPQFTSWLVHVPSRDKVVSFLIPKD